MARSDDGWTVLVFRVSDLDAQQRVLADFHTAAMEGVLALGTLNGRDVLVVVECRTVEHELLVEEVVLTLDPDAERSHVYGRGEGLGSVVQPPA